MIKTGKVVVGALFVTASLPVYIGLIARDITERGRYKNRPDEILYDGKKPTPNNVDFPDGPKTDRAFNYIKWVEKTFLS